MRLAANLNNENRVMYIHPDTSADSSPVYLDNDQILQLVLSVTNDAARLNRLRAEQDLESLRTWENNWDGLNSVAPNDDAIDFAICAIGSFVERVAIAQKNWIAPHVSASSDGEVVLEWWNKDRKLTLYVSAGVIEFIKVWGANIASEMEDGMFTLTDEDYFEVLWDWLFF